MAPRRLIYSVDGAFGCMPDKMRVAVQERFVYNRSMNVDHHAEAAVSRIAAAIGEPARARMLYCLVDGRARTSTELAMVADVAPSTASVHLQRLKTQRLVKVLAQGKHRYYSLDGANVAATLEALSVLAAPAMHSCPIRQARCARHGPATITSRAPWAWRCMTGSRRWDGWHPIRRVATMHATSPSMGRRRLRRCA